MFPGAWPPASLSPATRRAVFPTAPSSPLCYLLEIVQGFIAPFVLGPAALADGGAAAVKECKASCIGCKKCENICPADAIKVEDNFAHIDYTKCVHCNACIETCPRHAIKNVEFSQAQ